MYQRVVYVLCEELGIVYLGRGTRVTENVVTAGENDAPPAAAPKIAGLSVLKGLVLYGAIVTFAGLYGYFIVRISTAKAHTPPSLDAALVSAAAALAGVLGSSFALEIGTTTDPASTNDQVKAALKRARTLRQQVSAHARQLLSLEASSTESASWPQTIGIWVYAVVASAVAVTYVLNQNETPGTIRALAVAFGGYVIALVKTAYSGRS
jgi:hypothetical protein